MKWQVDEHDRLVITVTKKERRSLQVAQRRDQSFESDEFMHDLLEPNVTSGLTWLPEGCTDDLTSAPMLGILGEEMRGPEDTQDAIGMGLVPGNASSRLRQLRQTYQPVLRRWAFMSYAVTSPQRELAETGECVWEGGDFWGDQEAAEKAMAEIIGCGVTEP